MKRQATVKQEKRQLQSADVTGLDSRRVLRGLTTDRGICGLHVWLDEVGGRTILSGYMFQSECPVPFLRKEKAADGGGI